MKKLIKHSLKSFCCVVLTVVLALSGIQMPVLKTVKEAKAVSSVVENAISWAISIANNNSHGYSQSNRWGPDYDCSSFVISAFKSAGVNVGTATYTGNMRSQFIQHGFRWIPWSQIGGVSNLQRGDILLNEKTHTEIYLGGNQNVGAHSNRGYPQTGDQTGTEVSVSGYYYHPWDGVLRYNAAPTGKNPRGVIDSVVDKMNEIQISGWAFDEDDSSQSIPVHVYIGGPAGASGVEGHAIMANLSRPDVNNCFGINGNHGYSATLSTNKTGTQPVYVYGINIGSGQNSLIGQTTINISNDTKSPTISNVQVTDITSTGYTVTCTVSDNKGVTSVKFPSWSEKSSGDKAKWLVGTISGNKASCRVNVIDLGNRKGLYYTHIYAYDKKGNETGYAIKAINVDAKGLNELEPLNLGEEFSGYIMISDWSKVVSVGNTEVNVTSKTDTKSKKQRWTFRRNADGTYTIISKYNGKCLDVFGGASTSGTNVQVYDSNGTNAQKWYIYRADSGKYLLRPKCSNTCVLDLTNNSKEDGANIQIYTFNATVAQSFVIVDEKQISEREAVNIGDTFYATIENVWDGKVLSIDSSKVNVVSRTRRDSPEQYWKFKRSKEGYYTVTSQMNGKLLEVEAGKDAENQNVHTQADSNANKQKWYVYEAGGGAYYLKAGCSANRVLTLSNYSSEEGVNILTRALVTTTAQRFMIKKCTHMWDEGKIDKPASCSKCGEKIYTCTICGGTKIEAIQKTGHIYDTGKVIKDATCEEEGGKIYSCIACGDKKSETIPEVGHTIVKDNAVPPTQTQEGLTEGSHCCVCGKVIIEQKIVSKIENTDVISTPKPTLMPKPTVEPTPTPKPTAEPSPTPDPTEDSTNTDDEMEDEDKDEGEDENSFGDVEKNPVEGTILQDTKGEGIYKVIKQGKCVAFSRVLSKKTTKIKIPDRVKINGVNYKVTEISGKAFKGCKKLKTVVIGKNISKIGNKSFFECGKLKLIIIKTSKLNSKNIGTKAFKGINKKVIVQVPKEKKKKYKKWLTKFIGKIKIK